MSFEARRSLTSGVADEWYPVTPGSEGLVALALGKLLAEKGWTLPLDVSAVDVKQPRKPPASRARQLDHLADLAGARSTRSSSPAAIRAGTRRWPGRGTRASWRSTWAPAASGPAGRRFPGARPRPSSSSLLDVQALIDRMRSGQVETLFIHGANPVFDLPPALGFTQALAKVKQVISFASYPDETADAERLRLP